MTGRFTALSCSAGGPITQARDIGNRAIGQVAEWRCDMRDRARSIDDILISRVRAQLGHVVGHPGSLEISSQDGIVTIRGPVLDHEVHKIRERISQTRGVRECRIEVDAHESRGRVPGLQGVSRSERRERAS